MIPVMLGVLIVVFTITYFTPGDPVMAILGPGYTPEKYAEKTIELGLDKGYLGQLWDYIWNLVTKLDMGKSFLSNMPITTELAARIPVTLKLGVMGIALMVILGLPVGILSAIKQYSVLDTSLTTLALILAAIPGFVLALLSLVLFGVHLKWLPIAGLDSWKSWILPVTTNALCGIAAISRMTRTTMLEVIRQDYIRTARSKGQSEGKVIRMHALKNCLIPLITVVGGLMATVLSSQIIVETIFSIPGMGMYMMSGITSRDYRVINGSVLVISFMVCVMNLLVDILYAFIDPRIRAQYVSPKKRARAASGPADAEVA
jgi:peptide/nickel transport system permease protein